MTVKDLFTDGPLNGFKDAARVTLDTYKHKRLVVDFSVYFYTWTKLDEYAIPSTSVPRYDSQLLEERILTFDEQLNKVFSIVVYVYEGKDLPVKRLTKLKRLRKVKESKAKLAALIEKQRRGTRLTDGDLDDIKKYRRQISVPDEIAYGKAITFMKSKGMHTFGAPGEAEHQCVMLLKRGLADTILTTDADLIPLGATSILYDLKMDCVNPGKSKVSAFEGAHIFSPDTKFTELNECKHYIPEYATLLGTDYLDRASGQGPAKAKPFMKRYMNCTTDDERKKLLEEWEVDSVIRGPKNRAAIKKMKLDYLMSEDRADYIRNLPTELREQATKIEEASIGWSTKFVQCAAVYKYCPVFDCIGEHADITDCNSFTATLEPLNPLPQGKTWKQCVRFDPVALIGITSDEDAKAVIQLDRLLRFDGRAPIVYKSPTYSADENPDVSTDVPLPRYARLDFTQQPIESLPSDILLAWLSARGIHQLTGNRNVIIEAVKNAQRVEKVVAEPELQPKDNPYHWFDCIEPTEAGDEFDQWNNDWTKVLKLLKPIDDAEFDRLFGRGCNGVRERARDLLFSGNLSVSDIECINVKSRNPQDKRRLILFRAKCCPSQKTNEGKQQKHLFYHIHACAEVKEGERTGIFLTCPFSACSCINGAFFCSHREALMLAIALAQEWEKKGELEMLLRYLQSKEDPRHGQAKATLLENYILPGTSAYSNAVAKKKCKSEVKGTPSAKKAKRSNNVTP